MKILVRKCRHALLGLAFGYAFVPGFLWLVREFDAIRTSETGFGSLAAYYQEFFSGLNEPLTWVWLLTPYALFVVVRLIAGAKPPAKRTQLGQAVAMGQQEVASLLIGRGADVDAADRAGQTPLQLAVVRENVDILRLLLDAGADIDAPDQWLGTTSLHNAAGRGSLTVSELLVRYGADLDAQTPQGDTASHLAAVKGHAPVIEMLLKYRARLDIRNREGLTALQLAEKGGHDHVVKLITQHLNSEWPYLQLVNV